MTRATTRTPSVRRPRGSAAKTRSLSEFQAPSLQPPPDRTSVHRVAASREIDRPVIQLPVSQDQIAALAYELWQQRGGPAEQNWLEAEERLRMQAIL